MRARPPQRAGHGSPGPICPRAARPSAPSPGAPGTLKARGSACYAIWAASPLGFECFLLNSLFSYNQLALSFCPGDEWKAKSAARAPFASSEPTRGFLT
ncbi:Hypothetical predicted protein, partial [Marmota monax]